MKNSVVVKSTIENVGTPSQQVRVVLSRENADQRDYEQIEIIGVENIERVIEQLEKVKAAALTLGVFESSIHMSPRGTKVGDK